MPSPFPGMDPYLEDHWLDIHGSLVSECRRALNRWLPRGLVARTEDRVAIDADSATVVGPDVRVVDPDRRPGGGGIAVVDAPYCLMPVDDDPIVEHYIRVLDAAGEVVAVVEVVSPTNKVGRGLRRFQRNRSALLASGVHVVEIDLNRTGHWRALLRPQRCPPQAATQFRAVVRPAGSGGAAYLFPMPLRRPLPDVPVPLRDGDPTVTLPMQELFTAVYDDGRYGQTIDYTRPPDPPLDAADAAWAAELLAGPRSG